jgi:hypothetical protein
MFRVLIVMQRAGLGMGAGVFRLIQIGGVVLTVSGFLLFGSQCVEWLKTGIWTPHTLGSDIWPGWPWPQVAWLGVQKIIDWLLRGAWRSSSGSRSAAARLLQQIIYKTGKNA